MEILKTEEELAVFTLQRILKGKEIQIPRMDFQKEYKLKTIVKNKIHFDNESFHESLQNVMKWKTL